MLLQDGATVPASFGARPLYEADLLLVVKDEGINSATTAEEASSRLTHYLFRRVGFSQMNMG